MTKELVIKNLKEALESKDCYFNDYKFVSI